eukprot:1362875-Pyramimonas_sp.AAC.2
MENYEQMLTKQAELLAHNKTTKEEVEQVKRKYIAEFKAKVGDATKETAKLKGKAKAKGRAKAKGKAMSKLPKRVDDDDTEGD